MKKSLIVLVLLTLYSCKKAERKLPYYDTPDFTPKWEMPNSETFHKIPPFQLVNQIGESFTEKDIDGKICVADFFFTTCPGICPKMTNSMADLQKEFLSDDTVLLLSHSVTPEKDNVLVLMQYATDKHVNFKKWKLLTGDKKEIYDLGRNSYFVEEDEGVKRNDDVFLHTENFVLIDKGRHIRGIYNGLDKSSIKSLINDIKMLEAE
jgi:protein SCO1/2